MIKRARFDGRSRVVLCTMISVLLGSLFSARTSHADQWARTAGGEKAELAASLLQTRDGGYVVLGSTKSFSSTEDLFDLWVLKLDMLGTIEWQKAFGGEGRDEGVKIIQTEDDGYIVAANTDSFGNGKTDLWLLKVDATGGIEWQRTYGGEEDDRIVDLQPSADGGYVVLGSTDSFGAGKNDIWVLRLSETGEIQWQKAYGGTENEFGSSIRETSDGGYILCGTSASFGSGGEDIWVLRLNGDGTIRWQRALGGTGDEQCVGVVKREEKIGEEKKERYLVAGNSNSFGYGAADAWVVDLDEKGNILWQRAYGTSLGNERCHSIARTSDEGYVLAGEIDSSGAGLEDFWVLKLSSSGGIQWQRSFGGEKRDIGREIIQTLDEGYGLVGSTESFGSGEEDLWMLKLDYNGNISDCAKQGTAGASARTTSVSAVITSATVTETTASAQTVEGSFTDTSVSPENQCIVEAPEIAVEPTSVEFDRVIVARTALKIVALSNTGSKDLRIERLDITGTDHSSFAILEDFCSDQVLPSGEKCDITVLFLPTSKGTKTAYLHIPSNDPVKGDAYLSLQGEGILSIELTAPANHISFSGCSLFDLPTFSWDPVEPFQKYQIEFSSVASFSPLSMIFRSSETETKIRSTPWKVALRTPGGTGGPVYWRIVGFRRDGTAFYSDSRIFIVEPAKAVTHAEITPVTKEELPRLSWDNNCNVRFNVVFGGDEGFSKKKVFTFKAKNPIDNEGRFSVTLKESQWSAVKKLVKEESGARIYWKVEAFDGASRSVVTKPMSFELKD